jgi:hypothetical protein
MADDRDDPAKLILDTLGIDLKQLLACQVHRDSLRWRSRAARAEGAEPHRA